jgi:hypothetical protein
VQQGLYLRWVRQFWRRFGYQRSFKRRASNIAAQLAWQLAQQPLLQYGVMLCGSLPMG